jgi:hypothetical protein
MHGWRPVSIQRYAFQPAKICRGTAPLDGVGSSPPFTLQRVRRSKVHYPYYRGTDDGGSTESMGAKQRDQAGRSE